MTLVRSFRSACDLANSLPALLGSFMDLEQALGRNFREDSLSDLVIASFLQLPGNEVVIRTPPEHRTGSDFDLALVDLTSNTSFQYRIQVKRLRPNRGNWEISSYRELAHHNGTGSQVTTLCDLSNLAGSPPTVPLYAFYNPASISTLAGVDGIMLADAFEIESVIKNALGAKPRPRFKRLTSLKDLFFPLTDILCPPASSGRGIATPAESRDSYARVRERRPRSVLSALKSHPAPDVGKQVPAGLRQALSNGEGARIQRASVDRPQIVINASEPQVDGREQG